MRGLVRLARQWLAWGPEYRTYLALAGQTYAGRAHGTCPCCQYQGPFLPAPHMGMAEFCRQCQSLERQRLLALAVERGFVGFAGQQVLHFAPDPIVAQLIDRNNAAQQVTCDLTPGRADRVLNIEGLALDDGSFDAIVCLHVLEHVDDRKALAELFRVLRPGGQALLMVPLGDGWHETYENPAVATQAERERHFGQWDHVRFYGADLRQRITAAGFTLREFTGSGQDAAQFRLGRGERVFLACKP